MELLALRPMNFVLKTWMYSFGNEAKDAESALSSLKSRIQPHQLILSVLAGITTSYIEQSLLNEQPVVRVMPNTSSMIGASATAIALGKYVSKDLKKLAEALLGCMGEVYTIQRKSNGHFHRNCQRRPRIFII